MTNQNQGPPADFQTYWQDMLAELASIPAAPEVEPLPIRSTDFTDCYTVHLTSVGPYRIFGYLSIPMVMAPSLPGATCHGTPQWWNPYPKVHPTACEAAT